MFGFKSGRFLHRKSPTLGCLAGPHPLQIHPKWKPAKRPPISDSFSLQSPRSLADGHSELAVQKDCRPWKSGSGPSVHLQGSVYIYTPIYLYHTRSSLKSPWSLVEGKSEPAFQREWRPWKSGSAPLPRSRGGIVWSRECINDYL